MPKPSHPAWLPEFADAVAAGKLAGALALLEARATAHAGTPKAADKLAAAGAVLRACADEPDRLLRWARWLSEQPGPTAAELLALLSPHTYPHQPDETLDSLQRLADHDNWEVREWAASALGDLLDQRFDEIQPVLAGWLSHPSQFVRRAVPVAAKDAAKHRLPQRCQALFALIEPLLADRAEEVRRNLGPFAVGGNFLRAYPDETIARVRRWARSDDEMTRWNAAMVFTAANARHHVEPALEILSDLARDKRRLVWMAVSSALRNLARGHPDRALPILRSWLRDERKLPAALALRRANPRSS